MRTCPKCEQKCADERSYCPNCGAQLLPESTARQERDKAAQTAARKQTAKRTAVYIILPLILAAAVLTAVFFRGKAKYTDPRALCEEYMSCLRRGDSAGQKRLLLPELLADGEPGEFDRYYGVGAAPFELIGIYDVSEDEGLDAGEVMAALRGAWGIETEITDCRCFLAGIVADGSDYWFTLQEVCRDGLWYIYTVE